MSNGKFRTKKVYFSQVSNVALRDNTLTLKAKGLYALIQSYITIENFVLYKRTLMNQCTEGEKSFESTWKELKDKGYLIQYKEQGADGKFYYEYDLLDQPQNHLQNHPPKKEGVVSAGVENAGGGKQGSIINTDLKNTKLNNTDAVVEQATAADTSKNDVVTAKELIIFYEECFAKMPTKQIVRAIKDFRDKGMSVECITEAMRRSGERGRDWAYATGILNSWLSKEALTLEDVMIKDQKKTTATYNAPAEEPLTHKNKFTRTYSHNWDLEELENHASGDLDYMLQQMPASGSGTVDIRAKYGIQKDDQIKF